ncbi:MAG TPA: hypothetical protein ENK90_03680, partial [Epsilonproteobacteria bacterium]|nr:hypothetical protein [Campylobacterota bacterium]
AFIGAGFVGWGSYSFGSKAGNVAKVGNIEIKQSKLNMVYSNIYGQYNQMLQGKLDDKKAKEMGLIKQAFSTIATQAKILNFAQDMGIVVSNDELVQKLESIKGFQEKGKFSKEIYNTYLQSQRLKAKDFEASLKEELIITKTLALLETKALPLEIEALGAAMNVADKIAYKVLTTSDVPYVSDEAKVKAFWETQKDNYMTDKQYNLSFVWTASNQATVTDEELKNYYEANSFNYTDEKGKQLTFDEAKSKVTKDLKLKKTKKSAQKAYIAFKKGEMKSSETMTLPLGDLKLTPMVWNEIESKNVGDILKPKVVGEQYVTVKINKVIQPQVMTYEQAKDKVTTAYDLQAKKEALLTLAESTLTHLDDNNLTVSDFVTLTNRDNLKPLNSKESLQFLQKLFTSNKEKGIISVLDKVIVYNIIEQKLLSVDENKTDVVKQTVNQMKKKTFESNFLRMLDKQYPTEVYMGGLIN